MARNPDQATYSSGAVVTLTATPAAGWTFAGWSGDLTGSANPQALTIDANKAVTATFTATVAPLAPEVSISLSQLSWLAVSGATDYQVYESTEPYFTPSGSPSVQTSLEYSLPSDIINRYYIVRVVAGPVQSDNSNRVGRFTFTVVPGTLP